MNFIDRLAGLKGWRYFLICLFIGIVGVAGHAPWHIWPVTIAMFAVLFRLIVLAETPRRAFRTGLYIGFGYFIGNVFWIGSAFIARGPEFIPAMPPMIFVLGLYLALYWALAGWAFKRFKPDARYPYMSLAGLFFIAEFARGHVLGGFPWNLPGYVIEAGNPMSQSASLFGIYGLSLFILILAAVTVQSMWHKSKTFLIFGSFILAANLGYGMTRLSSAELSYVKDVKLRIVQVPFKQKDKMDFENPDKAIGIVQAHLNVTGSTGLEDITHVIWPEGAMDGIAIDNMNLRRAVGETFFAYDQTPPVWLMNSLRTENRPDQMHFFNSSFALTFNGPNSGKVMAINDKKRLVPFGEFIPGGKIVEELGARIISSSIGSITPAPKKLIAEFPGLPPGSPQICYEVIFPGLTPHPKDGQNPEWILNQSNDAWFGAGIGPHQHANIARYRAIEEKIPVIRSAANGLSGVIDPYGRFLAKPELLAPNAIDSILPRPVGESVNIRRFNLLLLLITLSLMINRL